MPADAQHPQPVGENSGHFRDPVDALLVVDGYLDDLEMQFACAKQQFIIAPEVLDSPASQVFLHANPILAPEHLGAAKSILNPLVQKERKQLPEKFIADLVGEFHSVLLHRVDQSAAIHEIAPAARKSAEEHR